MHAALTWLMYGQRQADSGDEPVERRVGYVTFDTLLNALRQAMEPHSAALDRLERSLTRELRAQTDALAERLESHENESRERDQRIAALEAWRKQREINEAFNRGFWHVVMLAFRWLTENWRVAWAFAVMVVGIVWVVVAGGKPGIEVTP